MALKLHRTFSKPSFRGSGYSIANFIQCDTCPRISNIPFKVLITSMHNYFWAWYVDKKSKIADRALGESSIVLEWSHTTRNDMFRLVFDNEQKIPRSSDQVFVS